MLTTEKEDVMMQRHFKEQLKINYF